MHPGISGELLRARHAELVREASQARRIAAARRAAGAPRLRWRGRAGLWFVRLGESIAGDSLRRSPALTSTRQPCS